MLDEKILSELMYGMCSILTLLFSRLFYMVLWQKTKLHRKVILL